MLRQIMVNSVFHAELRVRAARSSRPASAWTSFSATWASSAVWPSWCA